MMDTLARSRRQRGRPGIDAVPRRPLQRQVPAGQQTVDTPRRPAARTVHGSGQITLLLICRRLVYGVVITGTALTAWMQSQAADAPALIGIGNHEACGQEAHLARLKSAISAACPL